MTQLKCLIVAATDTNFLPAACCTIVSTKTQTDETLEIERVIFAVDVRDDEAEAAREFLTSHGVNASVRVIDSQASGLDRFPTNWRISCASYIRMSLDQLIDGTYDRVLYLDSDTRVFRSVADLLTVDLGDYEVAAARDVYFYVLDHLDTRNQILGRPSNTEYFNSGVMLFHWKKVLRSGLLGKSREFIIQNPEKCINHDQDAMNFTIGNNFKVLDPRWNMIDYYYRNGGKLSAWIKHYTGTKPWNRERPSIWSNDAAWYKAVLQASAWPSFFEAQSVSDRIAIEYAEFRGRVRKYAGAFSGYAFGFLLKHDVRNRVRMRLWLSKEVPNMINRWIKEAE